MNRSTAISLFLPFGLALTAAGDYTVFFASGTDTKRLAEQLAPYREAHPTEKAVYIPLDDKPATLTAAHNTALALRAGVKELPSVAAADAKGEYAALPLRTLTKESVAEAAKAASAPDRRERYEQQRYRSRQYYLFARLSLRGDKATDRELAQDIADCRQLMSDANAKEEDCQLLGLRCLYPMLMMQYARGYKGAHTPATEAKLLEAIAALEAARDLNPDTPLGREAYRERERLRMARRQARQAE